MSSFSKNSVMIPNYQYIVLLLVTISLIVSISIQPVQIFLVI